MMKSLPLVSFFLLCGCLSAQASQCGTGNISIQTLQGAKSADFAEQDALEKADMADALALCLDNPDPSFRDGLAYEGLTALLRSGELEQDRIRGLRDTLLASLDSDESDGFGAPFSALVLSEVARTDRVGPYLSDTELDDLVSQAAIYVTSVKDYRGFSDEDGWRHGVAHGADWLMQLSLNPRLTAEQHQVILDAVRKQVPASNNHAYIHGEQGRLARPVLFIAMQSNMTEEDWADWLSLIIDPAPMESWGDAFQSEGGLARLHNVRSFVQALYVNSSATSNDQVQPLLDAVAAGLIVLP